MIHHLLEFSFQNAALEEFIKQTLINVYLVYTSGIYYSTFIEFVCLVEVISLQPTNGRKKLKKVEEIKIVISTR